MTDTKRWHKASELIRRLMDTGIPLYRSMTIFDKAHRGQSQKLTMGDKGIKEETLLRIETAINKFAASKAHETYSGDLEANKKKFNPALEIALRKYKIYQSQI